MIALSNSIDPPTYLQKLLPYEDKITLVFLKKNSCDKVENLELATLNHSDKPSNDTLDITGSPLKVDLKGDDTLGFTKPKVVYPWTDAESQHYPMDIKTARRYLNQQLKTKNMSNPFYAICDGDNPLKTVLLGAQRTNKYITSSVINICDFLTDFQDMCLESMERGHYLNCRATFCKIKYSVKFRYMIFGIHLNDLRDITDSEYSGSICLEVTYNNRCFLDFPESGSLKKMILQILAGHKKSSVYFLWEELQLLQQYLDILSDKDKFNDPETVISNTPTLSSDMFKNIKEILTTVWYKRKGEIFDLNNIRSRHLLDKLWDILKNSENLAALCDYFHFFFEELVEMNINIELPHQSHLSILINGILQGKLIQTLSFSQALEFLFELGAEKMKNDYQAIIKHFYISANDPISTKWSEFQSGLPDHFPQTRITLNLKSGIVNMRKNISQLAYLSKLHLVTEFLYLIKNKVFLPTETFSYLYQIICKHYIESVDASYSFVELMQNRLKEFNIVLDITDKNIIKQEMPVTWSIQMTSSFCNSEITTVYYLSKYPIIPPSIYDKYDVENIAVKDEFYYTYKLERHKDLI